LANQRGKRPTSPTSQEGSASDGDEGHNERRLLLNQRAQRNPCEDANDRKASPNRQHGKPAVSAAIEPIYQWLT
jgi:hypothetical protein